MRPTECKTGKVRFSYCHVFKPYAMQEGQPEKYSVSILIPKSDKATLKKLQAAIDAAIADGKASKWSGKVPANLKTPLRDGDEDRPDDPNYEGMYFINASGNQKPGIIGPDKEELFDDEEFYSGCYGRAIINFYPFNVNGNRGVAAGLQALQKLEEGERLGGAGGGVKAAVAYFSDDEDDDIL